RAWSIPHKRLAGVSSFGFGGTNAHIILEEAPGNLSRLIDDVHSDTHTDEPLVDRSHHLLTLSAKSEAALQELGTRYEQYLAAYPDVAWADVCFTANFNRSQFPHRLTIVAASQKEAQEKLSAFTSGKTASGVIQGQRTTKLSKIAFLFTGQGSQYIDMGLELYQTQPIFRQTLDHCDTILRADLDISLLEILYPNLSEKDETTTALPTHAQHSPALINQTAYTQPALFALQCALVDLWKSWGISPDMVMGHSIGEFAAAYAAGVFTLEDGLKLIAKRGQLMQALPQTGEMVIVFGAESQLSSVLEPYADQVSVAALNGVETVVISGHKTPIEIICEQLDAQGIKTERLNVSHAFHSPLMDPILTEFKQVIETISLSQPHTTFISTVTGQVITTEITDPCYWARQIRQSVRFTDSVETLYQQGCNFLIEIGPQPTLLGLARQHLSAIANTDSHINIEYLPTLRQTMPAWQQILQTLGTLFVQGLAVDWPSFEQPYQTYRQRLTLPTYPFQRERYWLGFEQESSHSATQNNHPLLGQRLRLAGSQTIHFETELTTTSPNFLQDHRIFQTTVLSASSYIEIALAAGLEVLKTDQLILEDVKFEQLLILQKGQRKAVQTTVTLHDHQSASFQIFSLANQPKTTDAAPVWVQHASGRMHVPSEAVDLVPVDVTTLHKTSKSKQYPVKFFYQDCLFRGFDYGPAFQTVTQLTHLSSMADDIHLAHLQLPTSLLSDAIDYYLHPSLLDGCLQVGAAGYEKIVASVVPLSIKRLTYRASPGVNVNVYRDTKSEQVSDHGHLSSSVNLRLFDEQGTVLVDIEEQTFTQIDSRAMLQLLQQDVKQWLYTIEWKPQPVTVSSTTVTGDWLIFADKAGFALSLAEHIFNQGGSCTLVWPSDTFTQVNLENKFGAKTYHLNPLEVSQFQQLFTEIDGPLQGIIYLWSIDSPVEFDIEQLQAQQVLGYGGVLHLVQALTKHSKTLPPQLYLVTNGAQRVTTDSQSLDITQSPLWGLGRVIALEHPELNCVRLDLDPSAEEFARLQAMVETISQADQEDQIAYRQSLRYVARLAYQTSRNPSEAKHLAVPSGPFKVAIDHYGLLDN
ncbi:MAG: type I polyketide synthase, partial [Chloroflexota bacterium]